MYVGIDIGGTKTLVAALTDDGKIHESLRFPTPTEYDDFLAELKSTLAKLATQDFRAGAVAAPGTIDRKHHTYGDGGNLHWTGAALAHDIERITHCPMLLENDANLAALSEAMLLKDTHQKVLYVTISTGIGTGVVVNQQLEPNLLDSEGGHMMLQRGDKIVSWESFASGKAIFNRYHQQASEINDPAVWRAIAADLAIGFIDLIAVIQPDVIVIGGGVGSYLAKYHDFLIEALQQYATPMTPIPPFIEAQRPEEAVVYGCYDLARSVYA